MISTNVFHLAGGHSTKWKLFNIDNENSQSKRDEKNVESEEYSRAIFPYPDWIYLCILMLNLVFRSSTNIASVSGFEYTGG